MGNYKNLGNRDVRPEQEKKKKKSEFCSLLSQKWYESEKIIIGQC